MPFFVKPTITPPKPDAETAAKPSKNKAPEIKSPDKSNQQQKSQGAEQTTQTQNKQTSSTEDSQQKILNRPQDNAQQSQAKDKAKSSYQKSQNFNQAQKPATNIGHKINLSKPQAKQNLGLQGEPKNTPTTDSRSMHTNTSAQTARPQPEKGVFQRALNHPAFRGPLRGTSLHQKLQTKLIQNQASRHQAAQADTTEILKRGELAQLFRMRHSSERDDIRKILRYELARAKEVRKKQTVSSIRQQADRNQQRRSDHQARLQTNNAHLTRETLLQKIQKTSQESAFEQVLQKVLAGQKSMPSLAEGVRARFLPKSNWNEFFAQVLKLSSTEVPQKGKLAQTIEAVFRGLFTKADSGEFMLVSDLSFTEDGEVIEKKFSQLILKDAELAKLLKNLQPGDIINPELLKKLGAEFEFLQLIHLAQILKLSDAEKQKLLQSLKQTHSQDSRNKIEDALIRQRKDTNQPFVHASYSATPVEKYTGKPKIYMWLIYATLGIAGALIVYFLTSGLLG